MRFDSIFQQVGLETCVEEAQQCDADMFVTPVSQLVGHWWLSGCGDEGLLCWPWGLNANRGLMLLGKLASDCSLPL